MLIIPEIKYAIVAPIVAPKVPNPKFTRRTIKPVFRATKKVMHNDELVGILVINIFMQNFLKQLTISPNFNVYLVDKINSWMFPELAG